MSAVPPVPAEAVDQRPVSGGVGPALSVGVDAVAADGGLIHIRVVTPEDWDALADLHERASDRSLYHRFFSASRVTARQHVAALARAGCADHCALLALIGNLAVGVAELQRVSDTDAEIALLVDDAQQGRGIGTLLAEHLAQNARGYGYRRLVAEVLSDNLDLLLLLADLRLPTRFTYEGTTVRLVIDVQQDAAAVAASDHREALADAASLARILAPRSVAVVGASKRIANIGHQVLREIRRGGFTGTVYAVNPHHDWVLDVPCVATAADLPEAVDLAVIAVPARQVLGVAEGCGRRGVHGMVILSSGFSECGTTGRTLEQEVLSTARRFGMRLVGPNCLGLMNTDPLVRLNATFADLPMDDGAVGLASQSGALGIALLQTAARSGVGAAQFVSLGNKSDVSGNDLLMTWERDARVKVIALYLESFGNPRKFARIARRIARTKPIIAIKGGRTPAGALAGRSHTAAAASSDVVVEALFEQAGVLRVDTMQELVDAARVLATQPAPTGPRIAIVGNSGGPQILAADAAFGAGLDVVTLSDMTMCRLREVAPHAASHANPVDLGAAADADQMGGAVQALLGAAEVDIVLAAFTETAVGDSVAVLERIAEVAARADKPVVAAHVGGIPGVVANASGSASVPVYDFPEPAVRAVGVARRYAGIRTSRPAPPRRLHHADAAAAGVLVETALADGQSWLTAEQQSAVLSFYGVPVCDQHVVADADEAVRAAAGLGYPVVLKAADGGLHKTELGAIRVGIGDEASLRSAVRDILAVVPGSRLLVQRTIQPGTELIVGALQDAQFGPVVMVGAGGVLADLLADRRFALAPVDLPTALDLVDELRTAALLDGYRGGPVVSRAAVADLVTRIAQLADDVPQIAELDLNPVICRGSSLTVVDARIRVAAAPDLPDPVLRRLAAPANRAVEVLRP
ncbi:MAG TPA: GNAT family N-acetyltransferase [Nakamurella sp.]|nr:GNAT family N-acetyltransferase [Nakamurella sp.]